MSSDFTMKQHVDPSSIAALAQRQAQMQQQQDQQAQQNKLQETQVVAQSVGNLVAGAIEQSKARQAKDFAKNMANSMAAKYALDIMAPQQGPIMDGQATLPPVSTPDYAGQNVIKAAVMEDPKAWSKQLAEQMFSEKKLGGASGTPPRSFESYLIGQVNSGKMTASEAATQLSQYKPSNTIIGYTEDNNPIFSNSKAIPATPAPLNTVTAPTGGVNPKPERTSETELGKQADLATVDNALEELEKNFDASFIGPISGRLNSAKQSFDATASEKRANFLTAVNSYRNAMIKAITGAQMSEPEAKRLMNQLPNEKMSETDFKAKMKLSRELLAKTLANRQRNLKQAGYTGGTSGPEATSPSTNNDPLGIR